VFFDVENDHDSKELALLFDLFSIITRKPLMQYNY